METTVYLMLMMMMMILHVRWMGSLSHPRLRNGLIRIKSFASTFVRWEGVGWIYRVWGRKTSPSRQYMQKMNIRRMVVEVTVCVKANAYSSQMDHIKYSLVLSVSQVVRQEPHADDGENKSAHIHTFTNKNTHTYGHIQ